MLTNTAHVGVFHAMLGSKWRQQDLAHTGNQLNPFSRAFEPFGLTCEGFQYVGARGLRFNHALNESSDFGNVDAVCQREQRVAAHVFQIRSRLCARVTERFDSCLYCLSVILESKG